MSEQSPESSFHDERLPTRDPCGNRGGGGAPPFWGRSAGYYLTLTASFDALLEALTEFYSCKAGFSPAFRIGIRFDCALGGALLGILIVTKPLLNSASIAPRSKFSGKRIDRVKLP
jgi:hypothetical protein